MVNILLIMMKKQTNKNCFRPRVYQEVFLFFLRGWNPLLPL